MPPPTDEENVEALKGIGGQPAQDRRRRQGAGRRGVAAAGRRAVETRKFDQATRDKAQAIFVTPLKTVLDQLKNALQAQPVSLKSCRPIWSSAGRPRTACTRVEALPKGDPNDNDTLRKFASAVLAAEPNAIGGRCRS